MKITRRSFVASLLSLFGLPFLAKADASETMGCDKRLLFDENGNRYPELHYVSNVYCVELLEAVKPQVGRPFLQPYRLNENGKWETLSRCVSLCRFTSREEAIAAMKKAGIKRFVERVEAIVQRSLC